MASDRYRDRIVGQKVVRLADLKPHPNNWRTHSELQATSLDALLANIGTVETVVWNKRTGHVIDGHLRRELAERRGEKELKVTVVDLDEDEERIILATFDPMGALAGVDETGLRTLIGQIEDRSDWLEDLINSVGPAIGLDGLFLGSAPGDGIDLLEAREAAARLKLAERFGAPPFSVLDARQGWWQDRKRAWIALGIQSELGRGEGLTMTAEQVTAEQVTAEQFKYYRNRRKANSIPGGSKLPGDRIAGPTDQTARVKSEKAALFKNQGAQRALQESKPHRKPNAATGGSPEPLSRYRAGERDGVWNDHKRRKAKLAPGGSPVPAADYSKSKSRGDGRGRAIKNG